MLRWLALFGLVFATTPCVAVSAGDGSTTPRSGGQTAAPAIARDGATPARPSLAAMLEAVTGQRSDSRTYTGTGPTHATAVCTADLDLVFRNRFEDASTCANNTDCSSPLALCDSQRSSCVECLTNNDCPNSKPRCDLDVCTFCTSDFDCTGSCAPHCDPMGSGACVP